MHTAATSAPIDTANLGGGTAKFRVIASDGFNTASVDSPAFAMANKPPVPIITLPTDGIHAHYGQVINFSGEAGDPKDGLVADNGLTWSSASGVLGTGSLLTEDTLPPGTNVITLTATNSSGLSASTHVTVHIDDYIDPDGPTLQVKPGSITWSIGAEVTTPQTTTLTVSNFGTGSLTWNVSSDSAWLTVSKTSGSQNESLVATGNPSGLNNGQTRSGNLIFTTVSNGYTQTVTVPVSLIKGDIFQSPYTGPQPPLRYLYLPLVVK